MNARLRQIVDAIAHEQRRTNPPPEFTPGQELQRAIVEAGLKQKLTEADLIEAAERLGLNPMDLSEELASWL